MGINLRAREAEEKSKAAYKAVGTVIEIVKKQELMLNALSQMVAEMSQRQTAMEVVMDNLLGRQGLKAQDIIEAYIIEEQAKAEARAAEEEEEEAAKSNESNAATEPTTELVGVSKSTDQTATT